MTVRKADKDVKGTRGPPDRKETGVLKDWLEATESWDRRDRKESWGFKV
jgi:hypothetical protein